MATNPLSGSLRALNMPASLASLTDQDAAFWRAHSDWREAETHFESWDEFPDECSHSQMLLKRADVLRDAMLSIEVRTAAALALKMECIRESDWMSMLSELPCGRKVAQIIEEDVGRIAAGEMWAA